MEERKRKREGELARVEEKTRARIGVWQPGMQEKQGGIG